MGVWDTNYVTDKNFAIIEALSSESTIYGQLDENVSNEILTHLTLPTKYNEHALFSRFCRSHTHAHQDTPTQYIHLRV